MVVALWWFGCDGNTERHKAAQPATAAAVIESTPDAAQPAALEPEVFKTDVPGQLLRIYKRFMSEPDGYDGDQQHYREITGWKSVKVQPGAPFNFFNDTFDDVKKNGAISYAMLKKNSQRYAGRPWMAFNAKIVEIAEKDGTTTARIDIGGGNVMFFVARFDNDFVEKDRVDVAGYLAGDFSYTSQAGWSITLPALAGAAMFKAGGYAKMGNAVARDQRALKTK